MKIWVVHHSKYNERISWMNFNVEICTQGEGLNLWIGHAGKFGGIFASIPLPMVAAIFCIMFAYLGTLSLL